jgi:hypothetical protein
MYDALSTTWASCDLKCFFVKQIALEFNCIYLYLQIFLSPVQSRVVVQHVYVYHSRSHKGTDLLSVHPIDLIIKNHLPHPHPASASS